MAQLDVASRLEAVTTRLEKLAAKLEKGGAKGGADEEDVPQYVLDYESFVNKEVAAAIKASQDIGLPEVPDLLKKAFDNVLDLIRRVPKSKKPDDKSLLAFLKPGIDALGVTENLKFKGPDFKKFGDHYKACHELVVSISWVTMVPPVQLPFQHVEAQQGATDFNLNRILKTADDKNKLWVRSLQALNKTHKDYVGNYFKKTGLEWNPQGGDLSSAQPSAPTTKPTPTPTPKNDEEKQNTKQKPEKDTTGTGMNDVMSELSKGLQVTSGLKKVTSDMKTKNRADKTGKVEIKEPVNKKVRDKPGQPQTVQKGGRWLVENYNEGIQTMEKFDMKSNVFFSLNDDTTFQITSKVKAVCIDSCINCRIFVKEVVSTVELVNCQNVTLVCEDKVPSIAVDKSQSARIILMRKAYEAYPDIYTSNIAAMNIEIPGKTDNDDMIEIPVPEQFLTKIEPATGKTTTVETKHG